ncbi:hypothetical protein QBC32DRAFT_365655 [Pseudoneurospora amorphoporcata]|uniref:Uncharacterized protein n=1 Tax=Pseudoneurospora amorphoporcata TaxID=241081 RepID=A0AAN6NKN4_9PEZI|nr:hypothetical protein QBC32DRAFT_365655 [Pseudoneurospora amorphoporcata]
MLSLCNLFTLSLLVVRGTLGAADASSSYFSPSTWKGWGGNFLNNRWQPNPALTVSNINSLTLKCSKTYPFGVSATPVIEGNVVYYPTGTVTLSPSPTPSIAPLPRSMATSSTSAQ